MFNQLYGVHIMPLVINGLRNTQIVARSTFQRKKIHKPHTIIVTCMGKNDLQDLCIQNRRAEAPKQVKVWVLML